MIALGPAHALEIDGAPGDGDGRKQQRQKSNAEKTEDWDISLYLDRIDQGPVLGVDLRLDAQVIVTGGDAGDDHGVLLAALRPGAIAVRAVVVADFAAKVPRLPGVL